jgi:GNAT superfamily N-acetyltransferase
VTTARREACTIRPAAPAEGAVLSGLAMRSKAHWGYPAELMEACRAELTYSPEQIGRSEIPFAVAESQGAVIGFYALERRSESECELEALFVERGWIGRGIGRALLDHAKRVAAERGGTSLIIQGDPNADAFYRAAGGLPTGTRESGSIPGRVLPTYAIVLTGARPT